MKVEAFLYNDGVYTKEDLKYHGGKQTHASTFMVCLSEKKLGSTPPCIVPNLFAHVKHLGLHTCLAKNLHPSSLCKQKFLLLIFWNQK